MKLLEHTLLKILQSEDKMEEYLQQFGDKPSSIDPVIWQTHFSIPAKKRMLVLNTFFMQLLRKYSLVFSFLPEPMVLAKVYKMLNVPFSVHSSKKSSVGDIVSCRKAPKTARFIRYMKVYNSVRKSDQNNDLGIYEYTEERLGPFVSYAEFRKECKSKKSDAWSAADILNQLSKNKLSRKVDSQFEADFTHFSHENPSKKITSKAKWPIRDEDSRKKLPNEHNYKIFKSKYAQRLNVQVIKESGPARSKQVGLPSSTEGEKQSRLPAETNYFGVTEISDSRILCNTEDLQLTSTSRKSAENNPIERDVSVEQPAVGQNLIREENILQDGDSRGKSSPPNSPEPDNIRTSSDEHVVVVGPSSSETGCCPSDGKIISSSNLASADVPSIECSSHETVSASATDQSQTVVKERNFVSFFGVSNETDFTAGSACSSSSQSNSSCDFNGNIEQSKQAFDGAGDFDRLLKRAPLEIELKKNSTTVPDAPGNISKQSVEFDHHSQKSECNRSYIEIENPVPENENNGLSDSEIGVASTMQTESVIYTQRSSEESESPEIDQIVSTNLSSTSVSEKSKSVNDTKELESRPTFKQFNSEIVPTSQPSLQAEKPKGKKAISLKSTKVSNKSKIIVEKKVKKLTDFVAFSVRKCRTSNFEARGSDTPTIGLGKKGLPADYEPKNSSSLQLVSLQIQSGNRRPVRKVKKLFSEGDQLLLRSPAEEWSSTDVDSDSGMRNSPSLPSIADSSMENEKISDSDSSSTVLSHEFRTLSLASEKSHVLFPSQSLKYSPSSTRGDVMDSQVPTEITLDQIDRMMRGVIPNEYPQSRFDFDFPFKNSPTYENFEEKFESNDFSQSSSSSCLLEKTLTANERDFSTLECDKVGLSVRDCDISNFGTQDTTSTLSKSNFSQSFPWKASPKEDTNDEFPTTNIFDSGNSFSIHETSFGQKKLKRSSQDMEDSLSSRRHCFSLLIENKSSKRSYKPRKIDVVNDDYSSDDDIFRVSPFRSLPIQQKRKSFSVFAQQSRHGDFGRKSCRSDSQDKENRLNGGKSQQKVRAAVCGSKKSSLLASRKSQNCSNFCKYKTSAESLKMSKFQLSSEDDYESDELNLALNDGLSRFNKRKENKELADDDAKSTTSCHYDEEIAQLLNDYKALNAEQQPLSLSSSSSNLKSMSFMSTLKAKSSSQLFSQTDSQIRSLTPMRKQGGPGASNYKERMWNSFPDSLVTVLTTPDEKLEEVRNNLKDKFIYSSSKKLFSSSQKSKSSRGTENDSFGFLDWN